jgi:predicted TIM-barrel fold metal-dependent hydrolase
MMRTPIIDIHPHIVSEDTDRYPITPLMGIRSDWSHKRSVTIETLIQSMDAAGVDKAAVVHSSTTYGFDCSYLADSVQRFPGRVTGVFSVDVLDPNAPSAMRDWVARGNSGMRIFTRGSTIKVPWVAIDDPRIFPCYELAGTLGISVASNVTADVFGQLENILAKFPHVKFLLDHLGSVDFSDGAPYDKAAPLWRLAKFPNLFLKIATRNFYEAAEGASTTQRLCERVVSEFGANRIAWGSNYPATAGSLADLLDVARNGLASLSESDRSWILGGTALRLYPALGLD